MPWSTSDRSRRLPPDWKARRAAARGRAAGRCEHIDVNGMRCTEPGSECDHIVPNDDHSPENLRWICAAHHRVKSVAEGHAAMREIRAKAKHPVENHPALRRGRYEPPPF